MVFKGACLAASYPDPALRPFRDIDVIAADAESVHRRLRAAGFVELGSASYYDRLHHLVPLALPQLPLVVEVHRRPEWVSWSNPPSASWIIERGSPAPFGNDRILFPHPADHALLVAAHSWATLPLRRLLDFLDISLLTTGAGHATVFELAREWELERVWRCMIGVADALLGTGSIPFALRTWGRNLRTARDLNVIEAHVRRLASPFWALPASRAIPAAIEALGREFVPGPEDDWRTKTARIAAAVRQQAVDGQVGSRSRAGGRAAKPWRASTLRHTPQRPPSHTSPQFDARNYPDGCNHHSQGQLSQPVDRTNLRFFCVELDAKRGELSDAK